MARIGGQSRAQALAGELEKNYPLSTMLKLYWLPTINAAIAVNQGNSSQAMVDLEPAAPYDLVRQDYPSTTSTRRTCAGMLTCWHATAQRLPPSSRS